MDNSHKEGFAGTLFNFRLTDLIQMCCISDQSQCIEVTKGSEHGLIVIQEGEIIHAAYGKIKGEEAFFTILLWDKGSFETSNISSSYEANISKNYQYLLMEAARREDEQAALIESEQSCDNDLKKKIRVMIVDDSLSMCRILSSLISSDKSLELVGTAKNGESALKQMDILKPDLITMDVNMPVMDGGTALRHIMLKSPCPVVIISSPGSRSDSNVLDFLRLGAVDFIQKPMQKSSLDFEKTLISRIKKAAGAKTTNFVRARAMKIAQKTRHNSEPEEPGRVLVLINSGMGGFAELLNLLAHIPDKAGICAMVFQDVHGEFVKPMSAYLDKLSALFVEPLTENSSLFSDRCIIGNSLDAGKISLSIKENTPFIVNNPEPVQENSFDNFLESALKVYQEKLFVVLLSGAKSTNTDILKRINEKGGSVILQKPSTCMFPPFCISKDEKLCTSLSDTGFMVEAGSEEIKRLILESAKA